MNPPYRPLRVVLFGAYAGGLRAFHTITRLGCEVPFVITTEAKSGDQLAQVTTRQQVIVYRSVHFAEEPCIAEDILMHQVDLLVSVQFPRLISARLLNAPRIGAFNVHGGPLPAYPGLDPSKRALENHDTEYGATLHWMTPAYDAGPVAFQRAFPITPGHDWVLLLRDSLSTGMELLAQLIAVADQNPTAIPRIEQPYIATRQRAEFLTRGTKQ